MQVFTPVAIARASGSKYLGVLVAAKFARRLNELRRGEMLDDPEIAASGREKLTTTALAEVCSGELAYHLDERRPPGFD